jgi:uncharacterized protein YbjT (DUF2867 family)
VGADIAEVSTVALTSDAHAGEALAITGPAALSYAQMTARLSAALDRKLTFEPISDEQARSNLLGFGLAPDLVAALILLWSELRQGLVSIVTGEVERVTGRKPITFDQWARENAAAFG